MERGGTEMYSAPFWYGVIAPQMALGGIVRFKLTSLLRAWNTLRCVMETEGLGSFFQLIFQLRMCFNEYK
jgi:hypothetical protein